MSFVTAVGYDITDPGSAPNISAGLSAGLMGTVGAYSYKVSFVTGFGESKAGPASASVVAANGSMELLLIPIPADKNVIARRIYRTVEGGAIYLLLTTIADNTTTTYTDLLADGSLGAAEPIVNNASSESILRGYVTFSRPIQQPVSPAVTAGPALSQATATPLTAAVNIITVVAVNNGSVILPQITAVTIGQQVTVRNNSALNVAVYPGVGQQIDSYGTNVSVTLGPQQVLTFMSVSSTQWSIIASGTTSTNPSLGFAHFTINQTGQSIVGGTAIDFSTVGPAGGITSIVRTGAGTYQLPAIGTYKVSWLLSVDEAAQTVISTSNLGAISESVASRAALNSQLSGSFVFTTAVVNDVLSVLNPAGNTPANFTLTAADGNLMQSPVAQLHIERIA